MLTEPRAGSLEPSFFSELLCCAFGTFLLLQLLYTNPNRAIDTYSTHSQFCSTKIPQVTPAYVSTGVLQAALASTSTKILKVASASFA